MTRVGSVSPPDPAIESIRSPADFRTVLRDGTRKRSHGLTIVSLHRGHDTVRIGLVAGRRLGTAVTRNRIKRRLRHAAASVTFEPGWDLVMIPTSSVARAPFPELVGWIRECRP